jgi:hypothetical protein
MLLITPTRARIQKISLLYNLTVFGNDGVSFLVQRIFGIAILGNCLCRNIGQSSQFGWNLVVPFAWQRTHNGQYSLRERILPIAYYLDFNTTFNLTPAFACNPLFTGSYNSFTINRCWKH